jgi:quercetin dioxygenase-like cupin family protein
MIATGLQPFINTRQDQPFRFFGAPTLLRASSEATNGAFAMTESWAMPPGFASPYHMHRLEDEAFYILEGEMKFVCDGKWMTARAGDYVYGPKLIPHGFKVVGTSPARMLLMVLPGGFDRFVLELAEDMSVPAGPPDMAKVAAMATKYSIDLLGPLPDEAL